MRKFALLFASATMMIVALPSSAPANSVHDTCMRMAEADCSMYWEQMGYPDFNTCGLALYEECVTNFGGDGSGDGDPFNPAPDNTCYPSGRIEAQWC